MYDITRSTQNAIEFVKVNCKSKDVSPLAGDVIGMIDKIWGIHNFGNKNLKGVEWENNHHIVVKCDQRLSTVDSSHLTALLAICGELMLRMEIRPYSSRRLELIFHRRGSRDKKDGSHQWCPTLEEHSRFLLNGWGGEMNPKQIKTSNKLNVDVLLSFDGKPIVYRYFQILNWINDSPDFRFLQPHPDCPESIHVKGKYTGRYFYLGSLGELDTTSYKTVLDWKARWNKDTFLITGSFYNPELGKVSFDEIRAMPTHCPHPWYVGISCQGCGLRLDDKQLGIIMDIVKFCAAVVWPSYSAKFTIKDMPIIQIP